MPGAILQLVAYGIQDLYLTGDPQITFFKFLYRRHTNFSIESIQQNFSSVPNFGETVTCTLGRVGDLVGQTFLYIKIPTIPKFIDIITDEEDSIKKFAWVNNLGFALLSNIIIEIGGKQIDKQYGEWLYIWSQVSNKQDHGLNKMIGNVPNVYEFSNGKAALDICIPLQFWFCRNNGLSLPLVSLASSEVKLIVTFRRLEECCRIGPTHSIEIMEDICPFELGDYIEQTVGKNKILGHIIGFDYIQKKLYYTKIMNPTAIKKNFESGKETCNESYRIYNVFTKSYVIPKEGAKEINENSVLPYKPKFINAFFYVNYVYLDKEERTKFAVTNQEYLIEQIQFNQEIGIKSPNIKQKLALKHPCKAHYWVVQLDCMTGPNTMNDLFNYTTSPIHYPRNHHLTNVLNDHTDICPLDCTRMDNQKVFYGTDIVNTAKLYMNGLERFPERGAHYFNLVEPYEHHFRAPIPGINVYSFSLNPEDHQPSSAADMSEIEDIFMQMKLKSIITPQNTAKIRSYTINYNILRIFCNMGGLAFS